MERAVIARAAEKNGEHPEEKVKKATKRQRLRTNRKEKPAVDDQESLITKKPKDEAVYGELTASAAGAVTPRSGKSMKQKIWSYSYEKAADRRKLFASAAEEKTTAKGERRTSE